MAIQIRRGTDSGWESNNSNIVAGEPAVATDTERFFVGTDDGEYMELVNIDTIAPAYDSSTSYNVGDYCVYQGKLYVCNSATTGSWTSADWNEISLKQALDDLVTRSVPTSVREAIYTLLNNCAYATTGLTDEIAIVESWAEAVTSLKLLSSTLSLSGNTPQMIAYDVVPSSASVSWSSSNDLIATVVGGVVTGVANGTCTITATAGSLSATCEVTVSGFATLESISAVYTQSGTVYDFDPIDSLKSDLVVTATYSDTTSATIPSTDYTLSGTLTAGTSTITVTYLTKYTTFTATVTHGLLLFDNGDECTSVTGGWQTKGFNTGQGSPTAVNDGTYLKILFSATASNAVARSLSTKNAINLSDFTTVAFEISGGFPSTSGVANFYVYYPTTLNESTTQSGAYGNNYSSQRFLLMYQGSSAYPMDGVERTNTMDATSLNSVYLSLNLNCWNGFPANTWAKVRKIYAY